MKLYQDVFKQSWRHTIQRPGLWIFGFFAVLVFGAAGEIDRYLRVLNASLSNGHFTNPGTWANQEWIELLSQFNTTLMSGNLTVWVFTVAVAIAVAFVVMMIAVSVGALIHSTVHGTESFSDAFKAGQRHWLQLTVLLVSSYVLTLALTLGLGAAVTQLPWLPSEAAGQLVWVIVGGIVLVPFVVAVSMWIRYTALVIVVEDKHLGTALLQGWRLLSRHWLVSFEMAVANFLISTVVGLMVLVGLALLFIPMFLIMTVDDLEITLLVGQGVYALLMLFVGALLGTWQWSAWTLLFQKLEAEQPTSTLVRWAKTIA